MSEGGYLNQRSKSPLSLTLVIALHAAVLGALALSKMAPVIIKDPGPLTVENVPIQTDPPPEPEPKEVEPKQQPQARSVIDVVPPRVPLPRPSDLAFKAEPLPPIPVPPTNGRTIFAEPVPEPLPPPKVEPVRTAAQLDPRYADRLQPPYPASAEREGIEGRVSVRVTIGTDGRVKAVERISAVSDALWRATERHARANWRFKPATVDGRPVESSKTMSVLFEIKG